jgi:aryl-alcohol dehydrogenase-like predicted oxidoreductase
MTELAISWLLSKDVVSSVISGATKTEQVEINVKAAEWEIDSSIVEQVENILNG